jgi:hypothetical protein
MITRSEVLANRLKWIEYLSEPKRKKKMGVLDGGGGARCCLGHACAALSIEATKITSLDLWGNPSAAVFSYGEDQETTQAPDELMNMVGLWGDAGGTEAGLITIRGKKFVSLADANDNQTYRIRPKEIADYLSSVIDGGDYTPFKPLEYYPETI